MESILDQPVKLSADIIDTESNLKTHIIGKILFRLGFPYDSFDSYNEDISNMVTWRQAYAHGEKKDGIREDRYCRFEESVFRLMSELTDLLDKSLRDKMYLKEDVDDEPE